MTSPAVELVPVQRKRTKDVRSVVGMRVLSAPRCGATMGRITSAEGMVRPLAMIRRLHGSGEAPLWWRSRRASVGSC